MKRAMLLFLVSFSFAAPFVVVLSYVKLSLAAIDGAIIYAIETWNHSD